MSRDNSACRAVHIKALERIKFDRELCLMKEVGRTLLEGIDTTNFGHAPSAWFS